jgi:predicted DNA-binding transcriptional regulator AlpA
MAESMAHSTLRLSDLGFEARDMANSSDKNFYLDISELVARTGLSEATIWRLKPDGKIPFFQPGGKGTRVKFPDNAIEQLERSGTATPMNSNTAENTSSERLPVPPPKWMPINKHAKRE